MKILLKSLYDFVIIAIWLIFASQFVNQIVLIFTSFFQDKINQSFAHVIFAFALACICHVLADILIPVTLYHKGILNENKIR